MLPRNTHWNTKTGATVARDESCSLSIVSFQERKKKNKKTTKATAVAENRGLKPLLVPTINLHPLLASGSLVMLSRLVTFWVLGLLPWLVLAQNTSSTPTPPGLTYLYTLNCTLGEELDIGLGPRGHRVAIPITGGYFTGPRMSGTEAVLSLPRKEQREG